MCPDQELSEKAITKYRERTYRLLPGSRIKSESQALDFVHERQFIFFWPIKGIPFPSLWGAAAGDRPVPNNHDDPGHITWRWKDNLLNQKEWFYAKVLRGKSTIISLDMVGCFFALSDSAFLGIEDLEYLHRIGKHSRLELEIYSLLLLSGPLDSIAMRERLRTSLVFSSGEFNRALVSLQRNLQILPVGITDKGRWHYAYLYNTVENYYPKKLESAFDISREVAREIILSAYFRSNGFAAFTDVKKLFGWDPIEIGQTLETLHGAGTIHSIEYGHQHSFFHKELLK